MANAWEKYKQQRDEQQAKAAENGTAAWENAKKTLTRPTKTVTQEKKEETGVVSSLPAVAAIDPLAFLGESSTVTPASLVKGEMTGVGAKAEHRMASNAAEEAESALEKLRSAQTAANMAANPATGEAVAKSAGYSSLADLNKAVSDAEDALKDATAGRDAAAQRYYDLMGRKAMGGAAASDASVFNAAVEAAAEVLTIRDTYRYGGWTNDATSALAAAQEKKQKAIEALTAAGVDKEDAERAVDYAAQQKRAQAAAEETAATKEWADEHPVGATALSVLSSPAQGLDYVSAALGNIGHNSTKDVESYKPLTGADFPITGETQALREGASADMGAVGKFFYDTGMSLVDSSLLIYTVGPAAGVILGMGAASSAAKDALERGGTNDQALLSGLAAGAAEMIFEEVSIEKLLSIKDVDSGRILLTNVLKQAGAEAQEEAATEIANILFDGVIMGQTSNFNRAVQAYMADGMDESEAKKQAYLDNLEQVILAAAGGALSGGVSALARGGAMYTVNKAERNAVERAATGEQQELSGPTQENAENAAQGAAVTGQQGQTRGEAAGEGTGTPGEIVAENAVKTDSAAVVGVRDLRGADGRLQLRSLIGDEELEYLDKLSRAADVPINVVEARQDGVQGWYENGQIYIAENAEDPFGEVAKHELTHHLQRMAPAEYGEYRKLAGRIMAEEYGAEGVEKLIADLQEKHAGQGLELSREGALDELAADFTQRLLVDEDMFRRVARENRNLAQRLLDSLREFLRKVWDTLTHRQLTELERAERLWEAALRESVQGSAVPDTAAGTKYSFAGQRARTADREALREAETMEVAGSTNEEVRQATGWFRGADGKWRFEIDDSGMEYRSGGDALMRQNNERYAEFRELELRWLQDYGTERWTDADQNRFDYLREIYGNEPRRLRERVAAGNATLEDILQHDELFRAYPELRNVRVRFAELDDGTRGTYNRRTNTIVLSDTLKRAPQKTILHEVQHAIQEIEGFSGGASPKYWEDVLLSGEEIRSRGYEDAMAALQRFVRDPENAEIAQLDRLLDNAETDEDYDAIYAAAERRGLTERLAEYRDLMWEAESQRGRPGRSVPSELYRNTAGEIEARDAAGRRDLTAEQRRETAPDTGNKNTVFAEGGGDSFDFVGKTADGIEVYETSEEVRRMPYRQRMETFTDIMRNEYRGRTAKFTANGDVYYAKFDERDISKNIYGDKKSSPRGWKAKINTGADGNIFELVENAQYKSGDAEVGKVTAAHKGVTGWEYFVKTVQIDGRVYDLLANIRKKPDGEYVYSIQLNENKNKAPAPPVAPAYTDTNASDGYASEWVLTDAPADSISSEPGFVNEKRADSFLNGFGYKAERSENFHSGDIVAEIRSEVKDDNESRARTFQEEVQAQMASQAQRYAAPEYGSTEETAKGIAEREVGRARNRAAETLSNASDDSVFGETDFVNTGRTFQEEVQAQMMGEIAEKERAAPFKTGTSSERGLPGGDAQSESSVTENAGEVNADKQYSLQGTRELQQQMADLQKQNRRLEERNRRLKEQMKRSGRATTDETEVRRTAAQLLKDLGSRYDKAELGSRLQRLYDSMADPGQAESLSQTEIHREARSIAEAVLSEVSVLNDDLYQEYSDLRKYLRTTKINVPQSLWGELEIAGGYNEFRKRNMGRLNLSSTEGRAVEDVYQELSYDYPGLFDQDAVSHPGDQLLQLAEVLDSLKPVYENPYAADQRNMADWLAGEIMERFYDLPQTAPTFADRAAAKVDAARAEERQAAQERFQKALTDQEKRNQRKLERIRESNRQANARMRENMTVTKLRDTIKRHAEGLSRKLLRPTDKQHIPEGLRGSVLALLEVVDLESKYGYEFTRDATFRRVNRSENPNAEPTKRTAAARALAAEYRRLSESPEFNGSIDPDLVDKLEEIAKMGDIRVADMNREQLQTVWETVRAVESSVTKADKMLGESKYQKISAAADQLRADVGNREDRKNLVGVLGKGDQLLNLDMLTPETFLHRLGSVGDELHRQMRRAQDKNIGILSEGIDFYKRAAEENGVDLLRAEKENHKFELPGGTIELNTAQIMDLYGLSKRQQAMEHIYKGGLRAKGGRKGLYKVGNSAAVKVNYEDVATILEVLTPEQKAFVDKLQGYMSTQLAAYGNEASMEAYGYEKFKEKNYWPIKVSSTETDTDPAKEARAKTIPGFGMTKALQPHANNSVTLRSALDTYSEHLNQMATYAAWLTTSENITKLQNYDFMESGQRTGTVKALFEKVYGEGGGKYLENLLSDVAQGSKTGSESTFSDAMLNKFKAAKVGANLRVILQQPTAILRAAEMLDLKYLDTWGNPQKGWERAKQWAPIAQWKDWGYFELDAGRSMRELMAGTEKTLDKVKNATMAGAGLMDNVAWGHLWNAVEAETADKRSDLKVGTDEYYRHVAERFGEIIDRTQVVDSVLHRTQIMRSANAFNRLSTSFMSEPSKVYNMVLRGAYDLIHTEKGSQARKRAAKNVARTGAALVASFAVNAVAQSLVDALRDDDREKDYLEKLGDAYGENFFSNFDPLGYIPYIKDVESIIQGFTVERSDLEGVADLVQACVTMKKVIEGESTKTPLNAGVDLAAKALDAIGLPGSNIKRDVTALLSTALQATGADWATYQMDKLLLDIDHSSNAKVFYDTLYRAMSNDWDAYTRIYWDMVASGVDSVKIASAMEKRMADEMGLSKDSASPVDYSAPGEDKSFDQVVQEQLMGGMDWEEILGDQLQLASEIDALTPEDGESSVTDAQRRREIADSIFGESVKEVAMERWMSESAYERYMAARGAGISTYEYINLLEDIEAATLERRGEKGSAAQTDVLKALQAADLTLAQKRAVWYSYGYKTESPWG